MTKDPFKFLDSYTQADTDIFFGREAEIEEIYSRLFHSRILLVYGPSGSGKTSLLQCGVSNRFGEQNWKPLYIRCKENIVDSIHAEIDKCAITKFKKDKSVTEKLYSLYLDYLTPVYLIFDQFEELFIFGDKEEKKQFAAVLKEILSHEEINTRVILSIREEYLAGLSEFEDEIPQLFDNRIRVEKMKRSQALSVIVSPCEVCQVALEPGLAESALDRIVGESANIELTWLQVLMDRLYKSAQTRKEEVVTIRLSDLEAIGNIGDVLGNFLEEQLQLMPGMKNAEAVLKSMVSTEGTKRQLTTIEIGEALLANGYKLEPETIQQIVLHFVNVRILSDKDENDRYELRHDSLAAKIFERLTFAERELQEVRQFVANAYKSYLKTEHLLGVKELKYVTKYEDKLFLKDEMASFLNESKQILKARAKIQRRVKIFSIMSFLLLISALIIWAYKEVKDTRHKENAWKSLLMMNDYPDASLRGAIDLYKKQPSPLASKLLFESFYTFWNRDSIADSGEKSFSPYSRVFDFKPCKSDILFADYSSNGQYIFGYLADSSIIIWSQFGKELYNYRISEQPVIQLKMSPDNQLLTCLYPDSTAFLFNITGQIILQTKIVYDLINPTRVIAFSPDSKMVAYSIPENKVEIFNTNGSSFQVLGNHDREVTSIDFSKNGKFLATASKDHSIVVYYFNHIKNLFDVYSKIEEHRDIVWSVEFANNSKYVLSASYDSVIGIWDFNGKNILKSILEMYPEFDLKLRNRNIDASFSKNNDIILVKQPVVSSMDSEELIWGLWISPYLYSPSVESNMGFKQVKFLSSGLIYKNNTHEIRYISHKMNNFYAFRDNFKMFSVNESYMFGVDRNFLKFYPVNERTILQLVMEKKIFGKNILKKQYRFEYQQYDF